MRNSQKLLFILFFIFLSFFLHSQSVDLGGALNYSVPIKIPSGTRGVNPSISLNYSSHGANGRMGLGWSIGGISYIFRDTSYPVNFDSNDHYSFMGNRLIKDRLNRYYMEKDNFSKIEAFDLNTPDSYWVITQKDGTRLYFGSTTDSHIDAVNKNGELIGGKAIVWALNKVMDVNGNYYTISYSEDRYDGDFYPEKISYTYNDSYEIKGKYHVFFEYEYRSDNFEQFAPTKQVSDKRLKRILVKVKSSLLRKYQLDYDYSPDTLMSRLRSVTEYGKDSISTLSPIRFYYPGCTKGSYYKRDAVDTFINRGEIDTNRLRFGDFNGDGITDIYYIKGWGGDDPDHVYLSEGKCAFRKTTNGPPTGVGSSEFDSNLDFSRLKFADFNGDGLTDIYRVEGWNGAFRDTVYLSNGDGSFESLERTGPLTGIGQTDRAFSDIARINFGDFNGDGKMDMYYINGWASEEQDEIYLSNGDGTFQSPIKSLNTYVGNYEDASRDINRLKFADFNGDGKTDIYRVNGWGYHQEDDIYLSNGDGTFRKIAGPSTYVGKDGVFYADMSRFKFGDFNADGITDLYYVNGWESFGVDTIYLFDKNGGYITKDGLDNTWVSGKDQNIEITPATQHSSGEYDHRSAKDLACFDLNCIIIGDFNGDGRSDIYHVIDMDEDHNRLEYGRIYFSKGNGFSRSHSVKAPNHEIGINEKIKFKDCKINLSRIQLGDFDGDGCMDIYSMNGSGGSNTLDHIYYTNRNSNDLISRIEVPAGGNYYIYYKPATEFQNTIVSQKSSYPIIANRSPRALVSSIEGRPGISASEIFTLTYDYYDCKIKMGLPHERKLLGFASIKKTDYDGNYIRTDYKQDEPYEGMISVVKSCDKNNRIFKRTDYHYDLKIDTNKPEGVKFIFLDYKIDNDYYKSGFDLAKQTGYKYDDYGNVTEVSQYGITDDVHHRSKVQSEYIHNTSKWILNMPKKVTVLGYNIDNEWTTQKQNIYFYDDLAYGSIDKGNLTTERKFIDDNNYVDITHSYDDWGNKISSTDGKGNISTTIELDPDFHQYPICLTNAKGDKFYTYYDYLYRVVKECDINEMLGYFKYDVFNRKIKAWSPPFTETNPQMEMEYHFGEDDSKNYVVTKNRINPGSDEIQEKYTYYDGLGRKIQEKNYSNTPGKYYTTDYFYDSNNRNYKTSIPYDTNTLDYTERLFGEKKWHSYKTFDALGRVIRETAPDGTYTLINYNGYIKQVVDANGHVKEYESNALGQLIEIREYEGVYPDHILYSTTNYQYDTGTGNLLKVTDHHGNTTAVQYDYLGRKILIDDMDAGRRSFKYDNNGNLIEETNANYETIKYEFDELDRMTKVIYPDGNEDRFYYDSYGTKDFGKSKGKLVRSEYESGWIENYYQDEDGNVTKQAVTIDGITRTAEFEYDGTGNKIKTIYPDGEIVHYTYGAGGDLESIIGDDPYITFIEYCYYGKIYRQSLGNGVNIYHNYYDTYNELNDTKTDYSGSSSLRYTYRLKEIFTSNASLFRMRYVYDKAGNIIEKIDFSDNGGTNYSESYEYDFLNRLTSASSLYGNKSYSYDKIGNIIKKDNEVYQYSDPGHVHAVTSRGAFNFYYDDNGNMVAARDKKYTYNINNMLIRSTDGSEYSYFGKKRVKKVENGVTTRYFFEDYEEEDNGTNINIIKYYGGRIAQRSTENGLTYIIKDHLGSSTRILNTSGLLVKKIGYTPFGMNWYDDNVSGDYQVKFRFNGKEKDVTGLYYYGSRYYDPDLGRFTTPDSIIPSTYDPQSYNRYQYCNNNPVIYIDPSGNFALETIIIGAVLGATAGGISAAIHDENIFEGIAMGALIGSVTGGVQSLVGAGLIALNPALAQGGAALFGSLAAGTVTGGLGAALNGSNILEGALFGMVTGTIGHSAGFIAGGLSRDFLSGFISNSDTACNIADMIGATASKSVGAGITGGNVLEAALMGAGMTAFALATGLKDSQYCFVKGTKIKTEQGFKNIEEIKPGDMVWSMNEKNGSFDYKEVIQTFINETDKIIKITIDEEIIETTPEHPFWVIEKEDYACLNYETMSRPEGVWLSAEQLKPGMLLFTADSSIEIIDSIDFINKNETTYNFEVSDFHTYCVSEKSIVVHNTCDVTKDKCEYENEAYGILYSYSGEEGKIQLGAGLKLSYLWGKFQPEIRTTVFNTTGSNDDISYRISASITKSNFEVKYNLLSSGEHQLSLTGNISYERIFLLGGIPFTLGVKGAGGARILWYTDDKCLNLGIQTRGYADVTFGPGTTIKNVGAQLFIRARVLGDVGFNMCIPRDKLGF